MIILITGASHTGKTLLTQRLLERYKYPYLSIDHLKMGLIRSGNTELTPQDDDALTEYLWPIVREIIKTAIENRQNLIVEGCYIPPDWRKDFDEGYLPSIRFICLAMTEGYIEDHFDEIMGHASDIESRKLDSDCTIASLKADGKNYIDRFRNAGGQIVLISGDYEQALWAAVLSLDECNESRRQLSPEKYAGLGYCGVDCFACPDYVNKKCPSCRESDWKDESCMPVDCCREKEIALCAICNGFPCQSMAEFYEESDVHRAAFVKMQSIRSLEQMNCRIINGAGQMQIPDIVRLLRMTYWADNRSVEQIEASVRNSACYGVYLEDEAKLVGFARVISDFATTYYLCDVVIDPAYRNHGLGTALVAYIEALPVYAGLRGILITRDAHALYEKFGYEVLNDRVMVKGLNC